MEKLTLFFFFLERWWDPCELTDKAKDYFTSWIVCWYRFFFSVWHGVCLFVFRPLQASSVVTQSLHTGVGFDLFLFWGRLLRLWPTINEIMSTGSFILALIRDYLMSWFALHFFPSVPRTDPSLTLNQCSRMWPSVQGWRVQLTCLRVDYQLWTTLQEVSLAILMWLDNYCF